MNDDRWPNEAHITQVRIARPTDQLAEVVRFYRDGIGLAEVGGFGGLGHAGYDGVMLGLPGVAYHLEFTQHQGGSPGPAPTRDNLLVFYVPDQSEADTICERLQAMGYPPVEPENPYWAGYGTTFADPDGWRIVIQRTKGITSRVRS